MALTMRLVVSFSTCCRCSAIIIDVVFTKVQRDWINNSIIVLKFAVVISTKLPKHDYISCKKIDSYKN